MFTVHTPNVYNHNYAWLTLHRGVFIFQVRACAYAHLALLETPGDTSTNAYELVLGNSQNSKTTLYRGTSTSGSVVKEEDTRDTLHCDVLQDFWIRWGYDDYIRVGMGPLDSNLLLEWRDEKASQYIHSVSLATSEENTGEWQFSDEAGKTNLAI